MNNFYFLTGYVWIVAISFAINLYNDNNEIINDYKWKIKFNLKTLFYDKKFRGHYKEKFQK